ncbi:lysophospholipid acyltransferase family protein [Mesomycoplasma molare]|uniref:1-acyl-sn-glycerol-3-phosphate acyltransferase n=1 Tax=Mesomycoplasma molare TaxID=171288 RepID=A0ABY5TTV3_9BACT|nr:lysophospholipid acyltransferase family protein [Mesomycoplasma molare]UWD34093.1 1-acyl-sn-glycerol-3-phosphate acyltransferase [Mesomycoplasma molare]
MIKLKQILLAPIWLYRLNKIRRMSKKYKKGKLELSAQFRNDLILKYANKLLKLYNVNLIIKGKENITSKNSLIVANHLSNADAFIIFSALQSILETKHDPKKIVTFLAKIELTKNWTSRSVLNLIDTFFIDRSKIKDSVKTIDDFGNFIKNNKTYGVIFPEGTRSESGEIQNFKAGAFRVAKKMLLPILPVTINFSGKVFDSSRTKKLNVEVIFHPSLKPSSFVSQSNEAISLRVKDIIESRYIKSLPEKKRDKK